jgi:hypothetical protein
MARSRHFAAAQQLSRRSRHWADFMRLRLWPVLETVGDAGRVAANAASPNAGRVGVNDQGLWRPKPCGCLRAAVHCAQRSSPHYERKRNGAERDRHQHVAGALGHVDCLAAKPLGPIRRYAYRRPGTPSNPKAKTEIKGLPRPKIFCLGEQDERRHSAPRRPVSFVLVLEPASSRSLLFIPPLAAATQP